MPWFLLDKPWLISDARELLAEAEEVAEMCEKFAATWPGPESTHHAKVQWAKNVCEAHNEKCYKKNLDLSQEPSRAVREIMSQLLPEDVVVVEILIRRDQIPALELSPDEERAFLNADRTMYHRTDWDEQKHPTFARFKQWLMSKAPAGTTIEQGVPRSKRQDLVVLTQIEAEADDTIADTVTEKLRAIGLMRACISSVNEPLLNSLMRDVPVRLRDCFYYPAPKPARMAAPKACSKGAKRLDRTQLLRLSDDEDELSDDGCSLRVGMMLHELKPRKALTSWEEQLFDHSQRTDRTYRLLPIKAPSDEDSDDVCKSEAEAEAEAQERAAPSRATHAVLWMPKGWAQIRRRVLSHCLTGEGELRMDRYRLEMGTTYSSHLLVCMFDAELRALKTHLSLSASEKLMHALALLDAMRARSSWRYDYEEEGADARDVVRPLATFLRTKLLTLSDDELGLDDAFGSDVSARDALYLLLTAHQRDLESNRDDDEDGAGVALTFNWRPAGGRKSGSAGGAIASRGGAAKPKVAPKPKAPEDDKASSGAARGAPASRDGGAKAKAAAKAPKGGTKTASGGAGGARPSRAAAAKAKAAAKPKAPARAKAIAKAGTKAGTKAAPKTWRLDKRQVSLSIS